MEKIASDRELTPTEVSKIALHGFATTLGVPATGLTPAQVQEKTAAYAERLKASAARHNKIVGIVREHVA